MSKIDWDSVQYGEEGIVIIKRDEETKTLRDEFAMAVIGSVVIATSAGQHQPIRADGISLIDAMARDAYQIADAMMAEKAMMNARKEMGDD